MVYQTRIAVLIREVDSTHEGVVTLRNRWLPEEYLAHSHSRAFCPSKNVTESSSLESQTKRTTLRFA